MKIFNKHSSGFSLIEITLVAGITALVAVSGMIAIHASRNRALLEESKGTVLHALERTRSRAMNGIGSTSWGVLIDGDEVTEFEGTSYGAAIVTSFQNLPSPVTTDQSATEIIFSRVSGKSNASTTITISSPAGSETVGVTVRGTVHAGE